MSHVEMLQVFLAGAYVGESVFALRSDYRLIAADSENNNRPSSLERR
jgi:hypothetical protein